MRLPIALGIFLCSAVYVRVLDHLGFSSRSLQKALVVALVTLLLLLYRYSHSWKSLMRIESKYFFIFWSTILVQLLILSTGGLQSPFLIILHLFMIGLSFIFSFALSLLFL